MFQPERYDICDWSYTEEAKALSYDHFNDWVERGDSQGLPYLEDKRKEKRRDLREYDPDFQSALVFLFDYAKVAKKIQERDKEHSIAAYTLGFEGKDYHLVLKERLESIAKDFQLEDYKVSLDVHPVLERDLAYRAGLGWFGKNSMLIHPRFGSYFLIGSLLLPKKLSLHKRESESDHCGQCTRCIDVCPTNAIDSSTRTLVAKKCISTWTIETFKESEPPIGYPSQEKEIFGCDICQQVCPWNIKRVSSFQWSDQLFEDEFAEGVFQFFCEKKTTDLYDEINSRSQGQFKKRFKGTSWERGGKRGILKNVKALL